MLLAITENSLLCCCSEVEDKRHVTDAFTRLISVSLSHTEIYIKRMKRKQGKSPTAGCVLHSLLRNTTKPRLSPVLIKLLEFLTLNLIQHLLPVFWFCHDVQR